MTHTRKHIAVLIFALSQEEEIRRKPFLRNTLLQQNLTSRIHNIVKKTGLDYYIYSEQEQIGTSFGERFTNAIKDIYDKGYDAIITLGNDTPNLNTTHLSKAIDTLQQGQSVIGPSFDGGFYLMGLQKEMFDHKKFRGFSWNTSEVRQEIYTYLESYKKSIFQLSFLYDLDHFSDIISIYKTLPFLLKKLRSVLQRILQKEKKTVATLQTLQFYVSLKTYYNKGSPSHTY
ncbi:DUF2064 domain-containing protein [uncultured Aquimarina sp.]|uniref:DUF2064 domain-containing protein n=1 Tax=uncultured Aquimarina sp. TaxID=575652 RepID=UPI00261DEF4E|nr:DUF2064 domain-containing protein [uncultured Aquimarina sp.]